MKNRIVFANLTCLVIALSSSCVSATQNGNAPTMPESSISQVVEATQIPDSTVIKKTETDIPEATITPTPISFLDSLDSSNGNFSSFEELIRYGKGRPTSIEVSPKEDLIAVGSSMGVWIFNYDDLSLVTHLDGEGGYANDIDWSPDGLFLAVANDNGTVHIWNVEDRKITKVLNHGDTEATQANPFPWSSGVSSVGWSPDGRKLVSGGYDGFVRLWNPKNGAELNSYLMDPKYFSAIWGVSWSYDSKRLALVGDDIPRFWDINTNEIITIDGFWETAHVNWSPNNDLVALVDYDGVTLVNSENVKDTTITDIGGYITDSSFSNDGRLLAVSRINNDVLIWDTENNELAQSLDHFSDTVEAIDWSLDSNKLFLITRDNILWIWNTETWELLEEIRLAPCLHSWGTTTRFDWSPNEEFIALYNGEILDIESGEIYSQFPNPISDFAWSPDSNHLAFLPLSEEVVIWNIKDMEETSRITFGEKIRVINWSPNGTVISHARYDDPNVLEIFNLKDMVPIREITYPESSLSAACHSWSPDGNLLAAGGYGKILIYNSNGELEQVIPEQDSYCKKIKWVVDGRFLFTLSSDATNIYDTTTWESIYYSWNHPADEIAISNSGNYLAIPCENNDVSIINIKTDEIIAVLKGHTDFVEILSWSPSDTMIATSGRDGTLRVWGLPSEIENSD